MENNNIYLQQLRSSSFATEYLTGWMTQFIAEYTRGDCKPLHVAYVGHIKKFTFGEEIQNEEYRQILNSMDYKQFCSAMLTQGHHIGWENYTQYIAAVGNITYYRLYYYPPSESFCQIM
jgi:hypothetical protein